MNKNVIVYSLNPSRKEHLVLTKTDKKTENSTAIKLIF